MTEAMNFGTLIDVDPRSAWAHEAHQFTPWLAENLGRLGDAIGVKLEFSAREHLVGRFSADIVARNLLDDTVVLIENQLDWSDHKHLGQIMTYLAGTEAKIIVWVAPQFCDEHLSAIRWLNQHSHEEFSFFAVKLRVVQIAESPYAPMFDVLEKPNDWERSLTQQLRSQTASESTQLRRAFWDAYAAIDPTISEDRATGPGGSNRWRAIPDSDLVINRYKAKDDVGIWIRTTADLDDDGFLAFMQPYVPALRQELGTEPGQWNTFWQKGPAVTDDPASWSAAIDWLNEMTRCYTEAVRKIIPEDAY